MKLLFSINYPMYYTASYNFQQMINWGKKNHFSKTCFTRNLHRKHGKVLNNVSSEVVDCIYCSLLCCAFPPFAKTEVRFNWTLVGHLNANNNRKIANMTAHILWQIPRWVLSILTNFSNNSVKLRLHPFHTLYPERSIVIILNLVLWL